MADKPSTTMNRRSALSTMAAGCAFIQVPLPIGDALAANVNKGIASGRRFPMPKGPNDQRLFELLETLQDLYLRKKRLREKEAFAAEREIDQIILWEVQTLQEMVKINPDSWSGVHAMARAIRNDREEGDGWMDVFACRELADMAGKIMEIFARPWLLKVEA